jgi:hypothetical protein
MTYVACLIEHLGEAQKKGYDFGIAGKDPKPEPQIENYEHSYQYISANRYHESWMEGYEQGLKEFNCGKENIMHSMHINMIDEQVEVITTVGVYDGYSDRIQMKLVKKVHQDDTKSTTEMFLTLEQIETIGNFLLKRVKELKDSKN